MLSGVFSRRWVRWLAGVVAVVVVSYTIYYQAVVAPELTAHRLGVQVAGGDARLVVEVGEDAALVAIAGGVNGLSQAIATDDSLFVLAIDVDAESEMTWVAVPWQDSETLNVLRAARVSDALSIGVKDCRPLSGDAEVLVSILLAPGELGAGASLCGSTIRNTAELGEDVIVDVKAVRPSDITSPPDTSVVDLADVPNRDLVLAALDRLLHNA
jgi:hypothetical protein